MTDPEIKIIFISANQPHPPVIPCHAAFEAAVSPYAPSLLLAKAIFVM